MTAAGLSCPHPLKVMKGRDSKKEFDKILQHSNTLIFPMQLFEHTVFIKKNKSGLITLNVNVSFT